MANDLSPNEVTVGRRRLLTGAFRGRPPHAWAWQPLVDHRSRLDVDSEYTYLAYTQRLSIVGIC